MLIAKNKIAKNKIPTDGWATTLFLIDWENDSTTMIIIVHPFYLSHNVAHPVIGVTIENKFYITSHANNIGLMGDN